MPKVDIPLTGYNQSPDERTGAPRITRLVNCVAENGVIRKTPGSATIARTNYGSQDLQRVAALGVTGRGVSFCLSKQRDQLQDNDGLEAFVVRETDTGTQWAASSEDKSYLDYDEAPRAIPVFTNASVHFENAGVMDIGSSGIVVVAQGLGGFVSSGISFGTTMLYWAHFPPGAVEPASSGNAATHGIENSRPHLAVAGPYCAAYTGLNTISIWYWSEQYNSIQVGATVTTTVSCANRTNIDLAWDAYAKRLMLVDASGAYWLIDPANDFAVTRSGSLDLYTLTQGTVGIAVASNASYSGRTYVCYRSGGYWKFIVKQINDSTDAAVSGPFTIVATGTITDPTYVMRQPSLTAIEGAAVAANPNCATICFWRKRTSADTDSGYVVTVTPSGIASRSLYAYDLFSAYPVSKPTLHVYPLANTPIVYSSVWACQCSRRSLRNAVRIRASGELYLDPENTIQYPRVCSTVFRGGNTPPTPNEYLSGHANPTVSLTLPPSENGSRRLGYATAIQRQKNAFDDACDVFLVTQVDGWRIFDCAANPPDILQQANAADTTLFATALPSQFTTRIEDAGPQYAPRNPVVAYAGSGTNPPTGIYKYVTVREWRDASGNIYRSPPSDPVDLDHTGGSVTVSLYDDPWSTHHFETKTKIYRTKNGGTIYYLVNSVTGSTTPGVSHDPITYTDQSSDDQIGSREVLYTQGGTLDTWGAPACRCIWSGVDRVIAGGLENDRRVRWSNLFYPGEGISWPEHDSFFAELPECVVAVACLDGIWLVFSSSSVWVITGQGPDSQGQGAFDVPRQIGSVGAHSWRSLVETPVGLFFQATDRQIYLVQRGTLQVIPASSSIRDSIGQKPEDHSGFASLFRARDTNRYDNTSNWIRGAVYDDYKREVWFGEFTDRHWVLSLDTNTWRSEVDLQNSGGHLLISAGKTVSKSLRYGQGVYDTYTVPAWIRTNTPTVLGTNELYRLRRTSEQYAYLDSTSNPRRMGFWSSDIDLTHGRVRRITVTLSREEISLSSAVTPKADLALWFDGYSGDLDPEITSGVSHDATTGVSSRFVNLEFAPSRQKCNEFRLAYVENSATQPELSWHVTGVSMEIEGLSVRKLQRLTSTARGN